MLVPERTRVTICQWLVHWYAHLRPCMLVPALTCSSEGATRAHADCPSCVLRPAQCGKSLSTSSQLN